MTTWITWQHHVRTEELCDYLGIKPVIFHSKLPRLLKHPSFVLKTIMYLFQHRPKTLIIQCPSIILGVVAALLKPILGYTYVVDAHNAALVKETWFSTGFYFLYKFVHRSANATIVSNEDLSSLVIQNGGTPFVLPDKTFDPPTVKNTTLRSKTNIVLICTFAVDEPYEEVIDAFIDQEDTTLYVTGRTPAEVTEKYGAFENIVLTGFTPREDYFALLAAADGFIALTTRESCLLCSGYEAVSFGKPFITTGTKALRQYFSKGTVYTENNKDAIAQSYQELLENYPQLKEDMLELKGELERNWQTQGLAFKALVMSPAELSPSPS